MMPTFYPWAVLLPKSLLVGVYNAEEQLLPFGVYVCAQVGQLCFANAVGGRSFGLVPLYSMLTQVDWCSSSELGELTRNASSGSSEFLITEPSVSATVCSANLRRSGAEKTWRKFRREIPGYYIHSLSMISHCLRSSINHLNTIKNDLPVRDMCFLQYQTV